MPKSIPNSSFAFLPMADYFAEITKAIATSHASSRIIVSTMAFDPRVKEIGLLMDALAKAAKNGAHVDLAYDAQSYMLDPKSRTFRLGFVANKPEKYTHGLYSLVQETSKMLQRSGARVHVTNVAKHFVASPFHGRSHIKTCIIDETAYIGGCNLTDPQDIDGMIRISNSKTAELLYSTLVPAYEFGNIGQAFGFIDKNFAIDSQTTLLLDSGKKHQSIIYDNALQIINNAKKSIFMTCQFFPSGETADALAAALSRGVEVRLFFNSPHKHNGLIFHLVHVVTQNYTASKLPKDLFIHELPAHSPYIHAKVLANEFSGMFGSHNYVSQGVRFGTAEIAILRHNPAFARYLVRSIETLLDHY